MHVSAQYRTEEKLIKVMMYNVKQKKKKKKETIEVHVEVHGMKLNN